MRGYIGKDTCIDCGLCVSICSGILICSDIFKMDDAKEAEEQCPITAIEIK